VRNAVRIRSAARMPVAGRELDLLKRTAKEIHAGHSCCRPQLAYRDGFPVVLFGRRVEHGHQCARLELAAACPLLQPRSDWCGKATAAVPRCDNDDVSLHGLTCGGFSQFPRFKASEPPHRELKFDHLPCLFGDQREHVHGAQRHVQILVGHQHLRPRAVFRKAAMGNQYDALRNCQHVLHTSFGSHRVKSWEM